MSHQSVPSHPFRFNLVAEHAKDRQQWVDKARRAEELGYSTFLIPDHTWVDLDPAVALVTVAEQTSLHIGSHVFCNDFRNPVLLAKQAATLDLLSEGRFQLGLGCGYYQEDYAHLGIAFDPVGVRIARMEESIQIIKRFLKEDVLNFSGLHYQIRDMEAKPKPVQPTLPLYMGGAGKRILSIAAREADIVGLGAKFAGPDAFAFDLRSTLPAANAEKIEWVRKAAGERFMQLELSTTAFISVVTSSEGQRNGVAHQVGQRSGLTPQEVLSSMNILIGSPEQMAETLQKQREEFGISCIEILEGGMEAMAPVVAKLTGK